MLDLDMKQSLRGLWSNFGSFPSVIVGVLLVQFFLLALLLGLSFVSLGWTDEVSIFRRLMTWTENVYKRLAEWAVKVYKWLSVNILGKEGTAAGDDYRRWLEGGSLL